MTIAITIGGRAYEGWQEAGVRRALDRPAAEFSLTGTDRWADDDPPLGLAVGARCEVTVDGEPMIIGHVETIDSDYDSSSHAIAVSGRSLTGDLVDCAVERAGDLKGLSLEGIARDLTAPFGIEVVAEIEAGSVLTSHAINIGDSVWTVLQRLARQRGVIITDDRAGRLIITDASRAQSYPGTFRPDVVLSGAVRAGSQNRFSRYTVKSQQAGNDDVFGDAASGPFGEVEDDFIGRYRPAVIVAERQSSRSDCQKRAAWERSVRSARGLTLTYVVQGWRANEIEFWDVNRLIDVDDERLHVKGRFLAEAVEYRLGSGGQTTALSLVRPAAYTPAPSVAPDDDLSFWERPG